MTIINEKIYIIFTIANYNNYNNKKMSTARIYKNQIKSIKAIKSQPKDKVFKILIGGEVWINEDFNNPDYAEYDIFISNLMMTKHSCNPENTYKSQIRGDKIGLFFDLHDESRRDNLGSVLRNRVSKIGFATRTTPYLVQSFKSMMDLCVNDMLITNGQIVMTAEHHYLNDESEVANINNYDDEFITHEEVKPSKFSSSQLYNKKLYDYVIHCSENSSYEFEDNNSGKIVKFKDSIYDKLSRIYGDKIKIEPRWPLTKKNKVSNETLNEKYPFVDNSFHLHDWDVEVYYKITKL